jgi:hypothetical protein
VLDKVDDDELDDFDDEEDTLDVTEEQRSLMGRGVVRDCPP